VLTIISLSPETENLTVKKYRQVAVIGINRPAKRNALNKATVNDLKQAIEDFENDNSLLAAVLHGEGGNFCSGYDLEELNDSEEIPDHFIKNVNFKVIGNDFQSSFLNFHQICFFFFART